LDPGADLPIDLDSFQLMDERVVHALDDLPEVNRTALLLWRLRLEDSSPKFERALHSAAVTRKIMP